MQLPVGINASLKGQYTQKLIMPLFTNHIVAPNIYGELPLKTQNFSKYLSLCSTADQKAYNMRKL